MRRSSSGERELNLWRQGVAVGLHGRLAGQADLERGRDRVECLRRQLLDTHAQVAWNGGARHAAILSTACPRRSQLTAERENNRIEIAVSARANRATTARLSQASAVTLLMPQMSCSPLPEGSTSA